MSAPGPGMGSADRPVVLLCECAGTMPVLDFDALAEDLAADAEVERCSQLCSREGQARILELTEQFPGRRLVVAGCSQDFANRRFHKLFSRGIVFEVADIREACAWVHGGAGTVSAADGDSAGTVGLAGGRRTAGRVAHDAFVTDKARRIVAAALAWPTPAADNLAHERRDRSVLVIGGGVSGTQAACELAQMGHRVRLIEQRPFLGGRAARIGTVFPTNDCGQCLPTTDAQIGSRKCFHRNLAIDSPNLDVWRRTSVEAVGGRPGDFRVELRRLPNIVTDACVDCGLCEDVCPAPSSRGEGKSAIYSEFYDGRVVRTVDLDTCTFCGACVEACPVAAIDFAQSPQRETVTAGAILTAIGCEPAPAGLIDHLGYGRDNVVTQPELAEMLDAWDEQASHGEMPARELLMIQCAGSRDRRRLPYCSRLCCMIALKHAIRLRQSFPDMKVTILYLEMRTAGVGYENWYLAARRAGVEFVRGTPPEVQFDEHDKPVVEVEDTSLGRKRMFRPDLVVLSSGMVPANDTGRLAEVLGVDLDHDGFIEIMDRKNRATETTREGVFVCGSAAGPKALVECNTEASAVASEIHNFITSAGRRSAPASEVDAARCIGCDVCSTNCPFGAISLIERPPDAPRPADVKDDGKLAVIDPEACHACGICAATCTEMAISHNVTDDAISGRLRTMVEGVEEPVVGFYCRECAGAAISLGGLRRDGYPANVRLVELPCLGRLSALHIVEAAQLGATGVFLAGCAEARCQYRKGDEIALEQAQVAADLLTDAGRPLPMELWHLCAADRKSVGRRIRAFCAHAAGPADEPLAAPNGVAVSACAAGCEAGKGCTTVPAATTADYPSAAPATMMVSSSGPETGGPAPHSTGAGDTA
jgi:heterodisulfide reductase subunit A